MKAVQYKIMAKVSLVITVDEDETDINTVLNELDYDFDSTTDHAEVVDSEILEFETVDSRDDTIKL